MPDGEGDHDEDRSEQRVAGAGGSHERQREGGDEHGECGARRAEEPQRPARDPDVVGARARRRGVCIDGTRGGTALRLGIRLGGDDIGKGLGEDHAVQRQSSAPVGESPIGHAAGG